MNFGRNRNAAEKAIAIDDFRGRDFRKVVILRGHPKDRDGLIPLWLMHSASLTADSAL